MAANKAPWTPTEVKINGLDEQDELSTKSMGTLTFTAELNDPNVGNKVRMVLLLTTDKKFATYTKYVSGYVARGKRATIKVTGRTVNTLYYGRIYAQDNKGKLSANYNAVSVWTNRRPMAPEIVTPVENSAFMDTDPVPFDWVPVDPDPDSEQSAFSLRYRKVAPVGASNLPWITKTAETKVTSYIYAGGTFNANSNYEWQVATRDEGGLWGEYSATQSFYVEGSQTPPQLLSPINNQAVVVGQPNLFSWRFLDPDGTETQLKADLRYRVVGAALWITLSGDISDPGSNEFWTLGQFALSAGLQYEWSAQTYNSLGLTAGWTDPQSFWAVPEPGSNNPGPLLISESRPSKGLGCGHNRVFIFDRGGLIPRGEITPTEKVMWSRKRDDISNSITTVNGWGDDCGKLLKNLRSWMHEIVVFRDGVRVWEGPVTRVQYTRDKVTIEAHDVMAYIYRRILRQGYNDSYHLVNGHQTGLKTVTERAKLITLNALAYGDPNVLGYLTVLQNEDDARQSRVVADYSKTAWAEIDDMAATAGLDYTAVGRRIIYWDTHRPVGLLPEMRSGDFSQDPIVTEYGMNTANHFGVTNSAGVYGTASRVGPDGEPEFYGWIEQLASAYGETTGATSDTLTSSARAELEATLAAQAERNIAGRYPTPLVVRVPDNSNLNPELQVRINDLIPGVWIPLRAVGTLRQATQTQKLDSMAVTQDKDGEKVGVVMSPAPGADEDLDAGQAAIEAEG